MIRQNFLAARWEASSLRAPVTTTLPVLNTRAVLFGSKIRIIQPRNRRGLYSELRVLTDNFNKSNLQHRSMVDTVFLKKLKTSLFLRVKRNQYLGS